MSDKPQIDENTLRTMQELVRQLPKQHSEMKLGKPRNKKAAKRKKQLAQPRQG
jgi:hypothetical protein